MNLDLRGKRALVCGSTQGIGRASAVALAELGASVVLLARDAGKLRNVSAQLPRASGQDHSFLVADFADPKAVASAVREHAGVTDPSRAIHILVNNTGGPPPGQAIDATPEQLSAAFSAHVVCAQVLAQALVPGMKASGYGRIINIASTSVKQPIAGIGISNTVRAATANWAKSLANELGQFGITVNNVLPGSTDTERLRGLIAGKAQKSGRSVDEVANEMRHEVPARRFGTPDEIASAVAFLASPAAGYINGINLPVDGGRTAGL